MTLLIPVVFHWSPKERRTEIFQQGLRPLSESVTHSDPELSYPYLCFGFSPSGAWALSVDMGWNSEIEYWDLWQVTLADGDQVEIRPEFGYKVQELRVRNAIPADRIWWVGEHYQWPAEENNGG